MDDAANSSNLLEPAPSAGDMERRVFTLDAIEVRAEEGKAPTIRGYAAVFEQLSEDFGGWREKIAHGAFAKSVGGDVRALFNHDPNFILGRTRSKTLLLGEDARGLSFEVTPPATAMAAHVLEAVKRGDVTGASFGFRTKKDRWESDTDKKAAVRTLLEVDLFDVSPVVFPAYPQTKIASRALEDWRRSSAPFVTRNLVLAKTQQASIG